MIHVTFVPCIWFSLCDTEAHELLMRVALNTKAADLAAQVDCTHDQLTAATRAAALKPLPQFTSCCPGWINWVEINRPDLLPHLSTTKSPQMMLGAVAKRGLFPKSKTLNSPRKPMRSVSLTELESVKDLAGADGKASEVRSDGNVVGADQIYGQGSFATGDEDLYVVSVMPCTAKKDEALRPSMSADVDAVITTRELARMIRAKRIPFASLSNEGQFDSPLGESTGAAAIFGASGGVMEAALRTASFVLSQQTRKAKIDAGEISATLPPPASVPLDFPSLRGVLPGVKTAMIAGVGEVAVCNGIASAQKLLSTNEWKDRFLAIEVMTCVGGCLGGGGEPKSEEADILQRRAAGIYEIDKKYPKRSSHENNQVLRLYDELLEKPLSHTSERLLHTSFAERHSARDLLGKFLGAVDRRDGVAAAALFTSGQESSSCVWHTNSDLGDITGRDKIADFIRHTLPPNKKGPLMTRHRFENPASGMVVLTPQGERVTFEVKTEGSGSKLKIVSLTRLVTPY
jgi:NADP-reducing hydrogenase subunit HndD